VIEAAETSAIADQADAVGDEFIWQKSAPKAADAAIHCSGASCHIGIGRGKDRLLSGQWSLDVSLDGAPVAAKGEWSETCQVSDDDVDYLELELHLDRGLRVQRHVALARKDRFLFLADAILGSQRGSLEYRTLLPLCPDVAFLADREAREGMIMGRKPRANVLPLALPEWRADNRVGELTATEGGLELRQLMQGRSLFAPLFLDLDRPRLGRPLTWRQLTVAHLLEVEPADVAAAYRVALGRKQWLIYRSLTPSRNRTVLGHNLSTEFLIARFQRSGEVESIVEIE
jgi:hypothetical protein